MNKYFVASIFWAGLILILTLTPGTSIPDYKIFTYDKLGHLVIFLVLAYLFVSGLHQNNPESSKKSILIGMILTIIYGALIEYAQDHIPHRSMDWVDMIANCSGSFLGISLFYISIKKKWQ